MWNNFVKLNKPFGDYLLKLLWMYKLIYKLKYFFPSSRILYPFLFPKKKFNFSLIECVLSPMKQDDPLSTFRNLSLGLTAVKMFIIFLLPDQPTDLFCHCHSFPGSSGKFSVKLLIAKWDVTLEAPPHHKRVTDKAPPIVLSLKGKKRICKHSA